MGPALATFVILTLIRSTVHSPVPFQDASTKFSTHMNEDTWLASSDHKQQPPSTKPPHNHDVIITTGAENKRNGAAYNAYELISDSDLKPRRANINHLGREGRQRKRPSAFDGEEPLFLNVGTSFGQDSSSNKQNELSIVGGSRISHQGAKNGPDDSPKWSHSDSANGYFIPQVFEVSPHGAFEDRFDTEEGHSLHGHKATPVQKQKHGNTLPPLVYQHEGNSSFKYQSGYPLFSQISNPKLTEREETNDNFESDDTHQEVHKDTYIHWVQEHQDVEQSLEQATTNQPENTSTSTEAPTNNGTQHSTNKQGISGDLDINDKLSAAKESKKEPSHLEEEPEHSLQTIVPRPSMVDLPPPVSQNEVVSNSSNTESHIGRQPEQPPKQQQQVQHLSYQHQRPQGYQHNVPQPHFNYRPNDIRGQNSQYPSYHSQYSAQSQNRYPSQHQYRRPPSNAHTRYPAHAYNNGRVASQQRYSSPHGVASPHHRISSQYPSPNDIPHEYPTKNHATAQYQSQNQHYASQNHYQAQNNYPSQNQYSGAPNHYPQQNHGPSQYQQPNQGYNGQQKAPQKGLFSDINAFIKKLSSDTSATFSGKQQQQPASQPNGQHNQNTAPPPSMDDIIRSFAPPKMIGPVKTFAKPSADGRGQSYFAVSGTPPPGLSLPEMPPKHILNSPPNHGQQQRQNTHYRLGNVVVPSGITPQNVKASLQYSSSLPDYLDHQKPQQLPQKPQSLLESLNRQPAPAKGYESENRRSFQYKPQQRRQAYRIITIPQPNGKPKYMLQPYQQERNQNYNHYRTAKSISNSDVEDDLLDELQLVDAEEKQHRNGTAQEAERRGGPNEVDRIPRPVYPWGVSPVLDFENLVGPPELLTPDKLLAQKLVQNILVRNATRLIVGSYMLNMLNPVVKAAYNAVRPKA